MTRKITCYLLEPTEVAEVSLRRFTYSSSATPCVHEWGHDAKATIGQMPYPFANQLEGEHTLDGVDRADPRWPTHCVACQYEFMPADQWQVGKTRMYRHPGTGDLTVLGQAPVGSMWIASWLKGTSFAKSPDGDVLVVRTPGGDWVVDGPASGGGWWTRTGTPPNITVTPSIICGSYHGWLRDGQLEEC